ncbi:MAG: hypothetical protein ACRCXZ_05170 [Patescibacteria group bacterium]
MNNPKPTPNKPKLGDTIKRKFSEAGKLAKAGAAISLIVGATTVGPKLSEAFNNQKAINTSKTHSELAQSKRDASKAKFDKAKADLDVVGAEDSPETRIIKPLYVADAKEFAQQLKDQSKPHYEKGKQIQEAAQAPYKSTNEIPQEKIEEYNSQMAAARAEYLKGQLLVSEYQKLNDEADQLTLKVLQEKVSRPDTTDPAAQEVFQKIEKLSSAQTVAHEIWREDQNDAGRAEEEFAKIKVEGEVKRDAAISDAKGSVPLAVAPIVMGTIAQSVFKKRKRKSESLTDAGDSNGEGETEMSIADEVISKTSQAFKVAKDATTPIVNQAVNSARTYIESGTIQDKVTQIATSPVAQSITNKVNPLRVAKAAAGTAMIGAGLGVTTPNMDAVRKDIISNTGGGMVLVESKRPNINKAIESLGEKKDSKGRTYKEVVPELIRKGVGANYGAAAMTTNVFGSLFGSGESNFSTEEIIAQSLYFTLNDKNLSLTSEEKAILTEALDLALMDGKTISPDSTLTPKQTRVEDLRSQLNNAKLQNTLSTMLLQGGIAAGIASALIAGIKKINSEQK